MGGPETHPLAAAPVSGRPRWYRHPYNRAGLYRAAGALGWIPRGARLALARGLGRLSMPALPAERTAIEATLATITGASGPPLRALTADVFGQFAMCFSDLLTTNHEPDDRLRSRLAAVSGAEHLQGLRGGLVSVTAHIGNWDLAGRLLATHSARRIHVVVAPEEVPALEPWVRRDGTSLRFVTRDHPGVGVELLRALRRGDVVALQGDRAIGTQGDAWIPFFGRPAPFPRGPFILARAAGVPVVPAFCLLDGDRRYRVRVAPPLVVGRGEEEDAARAWVRLLEDVVREHPTQWFNFFDVWRPFAPPASPGGADGRAAAS